ncbi:MAG: hypothetical protein ACI83Y_001208 [Candidatus Azotimanducaceae bacterium]|jgi:hypothetical protein|tara:strand:- start:1499 stop:2215 length:717 start_codon:yes stop_codon:yes gene_type:complete
MTHSFKQRIIAAALVQLLAVVAVACSVPTGDSTFQPIDGNEIPGGLNDSTTTTSTTTTTTSLPDTPESTVESTTTTTQASAEIVDLYFISRGLLVVVETELVARRDLNQIVVALEQGPPFGSGFSSFVGRGLIVGQPTVEGGVIAIDLDAEVYDLILARNQRQAIAQIVWTFLQNSTAVGQVAFTLDGEPFPVPADGGDQEFAAIDDFASLDPGTPRSSVELPAQIPIEPTTGTSVPE